jgi:predicted esterase
MHQLRTVLWTVLLLAVSATPCLADSAWTQIRTQAAERFGDPGAQAADFLARHRPERDAEIDPELVLETIGLALQTRDRFPWAAGVDEALFLNDVLPYAVLDETRSRSRARLLELCAPLVKDAATAEEAAQAINRDLFRLTNVRYSTARNRANQCSAETMETGLASCTGLSIMLVDAYRSVGIPARLAGIAFWPGRGGNHTWVEINDGQRWRFTGAAEYDAQGLDRAWFTGQAGAAVPGHVLHGVWASSWAATGEHYPLVWDMDDRTVPAVDVSDRYATPGAARPEPTLVLRLWTARGGPRLAADTLLSHAGVDATDRTHADPDDINLAAELPDPGDRPLQVRFSAGDETRTLTLTEDHAASRVIDLYWNELGMDRSTADRAAERHWQAHADAVRDARRAELDALVLTHDEYTMRLLRKDFGDAPASGRSLWISMHGGGGAPTEVNDQQWRNQIRLYEPAEGIYIAPRAPSDTWNLWHRSEIDTLFDRLIESAVIAWGVDPDRVYLMGYSAGGDGVYQLAPRMADRFAAAAMMAGHPNDACPEGLRNLPFALFMGAEDGAYNRNAVARQWGDQLAELHAADPDGYTHLVRIYPGLGHWMDRKDAEGVPWMAAHSRNPWPKTLVWRQGHTTHPRFSWLSVPPEEMTNGRTIRASVDGQTITLHSADVRRVDLLLHDALLDLDRPITVIANGHTVFEGSVARTESAIAQSLRLRPDPRMIATASVSIEIPAE